MSDKIFLIAEVAQAHDGSLGIAHSYIDALAKTGVDAVKFQVHLAEVESSEYEPFRVKFSYEDKTRYDYWARMQFTTEQWAGLKDHCDSVGLEFMASPFSNAAVDLLETLKVKRYKIGSGEVSNLLILKKIALTQKDIMLSSGLSSMEELQQAVNLIQSYGNAFSILQCTTAYPTQPHQWGLNVLGELRNRFNVPIGFSDHSGCIYAGLAATALGADILEFHAVFDRDMFGPDAKSSLTMAEISQLVMGARQIRNSLAHPVRKEVTDPALKNMFGKSLAINKTKQAGDIVTFDDLDTKKPAGYGLAASDFEMIIGKKLKRTMTANSFLNADDLI